MLINEGSAVIDSDTPRVVSRGMEVFYNPRMKHNRDMTLLLLNSLGREGLQGCDCLAGTGIRSIRLLKETSVFKHLTVNDSDERAFRGIVDNLGRNGIGHEIWNRERFLDESMKRDGPGRRAKSKASLDFPPVVVSCQDASALLLSSNGYDYIEIDPFGSPNAFLDAAVKRISRNGILAITATDTSALAGSYFAACVRKYWATPAKGCRKHEVGLRILVRKCQLVGAQYDKALTPMLVYNHAHYYRVFFSVEKGSRKVDELLKRHGVWEQEPAAGPLWLGSLIDPRLLDRMIKNSDDEKISKFLKVISEEDVLGLSDYYTINELNRTYSTTWSRAELLERLGNNAAPTHHDPAAIRVRPGTDINKHLRLNT